MASAPIYEFIDLYKQLYEVIGAKIRLKFREGECEGIIQHLLPTCNRVALDHVYCLPKRIYMGTLHFFFPEILSFTVLETAKQIGKPDKWDCVSQFPDEVSFSHTYHVPDLKEDILHRDKRKLGDFALNLPPNLHHKLPSDNVIIDTINSDFWSAISYISQQKTIGVAFEGSKISRSGKLSWVCISTPFCIFLFDIQLLGKVAFDKGLRRIFQNKHVKKVIHDCRQSSDCLYHLFKTELVNVFDTQVADIYIGGLQRYNEKSITKYVRSLDGCLLNYLDVPLEYLHNRRKCSSCEDEVMFYCVRPISNDCRDVLIKDAVYLCLLEEKMSELMYNPFRKAVDICLNVLTNYDDPELLVDSTVFNRVAPALVIQSLQTVPFVKAEEPPKNPFNPFVCKFRDPQTETVIEVEEEPIAVEQDLSIDRTLSKESLEKLNKLFRKAAKCSTEFSKKDYQEPVNTQISVIENMCLTHGDNHIDDVNNLPLDISGNVNVKPSKACVSPFVEKPVFSSALPHNEPVNLNSGSYDDKQFKSNLGKCMSDSYETLSGYSSDTSVDSSSDSSSGKTWTKLRFEFHDSNQPEPSSLRRNLHFVPAGM